jgi:SsrA-binding protein
MKNIEIRNKRASFEFEFIERFTAGMQLTGTEIKSIRNGKASIAEGYCTFDGSELFIYNMHISEYDKAGFVSHDPLRKRKLLLKKRELEKLEKKIKDAGMTIVPLKLFIASSGYAKLDIALARGKKLFDKRQDLKAKDDKRAMDRVMKV